MAGNALFMRPVAKALLPEIMMTHRAGYTRMRRVRKSPWYGMMCRRQEQRLHAYPYGQ